MSLIPEPQHKSILAKQRKHTHLPIIVFILAVGHLGILGLAVGGRTTPYVSGEAHHLTGTLAIFGAAPVWIPLHFIAGLMLFLTAFGTVPGQYGDWTIHISGGIYLVWGAITLGWAAVQTNPPVSLLGPFLTLILAGVAFWTAAVWDDDDDDTED